MSSVEEKWGLSYSVFTRAEGEKLENHSFKEFDSLKSKKKKKKRKKIDIHGDQPGVCFASRGELLED